MTTLIAVCGLLLASVPTPREMRGPFPIMSTPYFEKGEVDYEGLKRELAFVDASGCPGVIWCQSNDAVDLLTTEEKFKGFEACAQAAEGREIVLTLGADGTNTAHMLEIAAEIERVAARHPGAKMAMVSRPPDDVRSEEDIERAWDALATVARRPVIFQTYGTSDTPTPSVDLLVRLAKKHPAVYGYVKEEAEGYSAVERMAELSAAKPAIKSAMAGWGGWQWEIQLRHCGCDGLVTERVAFAPVLAKIWRIRESGECGLPLTEAYAMFRVLCDQRNFPPGLRGYPLYFLEKEGVFKNRVSRQYVNKRVTEGGSFGVGNEWKLDTVELTELQKKELDLLYAEMLEWCNDEVPGGREVAAAVVPNVRCVNTKGWQINAEPSHADGVYEKGEDVRFDFLATEDGKPLANWELELSVEEPGLVLPKKTVVTTDSEGRSTLVVPAPSLPGWVYIKAETRKAPNAKGRRLPGGRCEVGAMCDKDAIRPALPPPADFKAFWDAEIAKLANVPMNPRLTPVALKDGDPMKPCVDAWEFELDCVGPRPATGYLAKPKKAAPKSLPIIAFFQGASGKTVAIPSYYADRAICVIANKFGIPNGLAPAEYEKPELKQEWYAFSQRGKTSRDEIFFKWLILRDLRVVEFAKSQPEWNGKVLLLNGESLGGGQSLAVGALDRDVTFVCACVPALSDHNGALAGRRNGWPKLWKPGADGQPQTDQDRQASEASRYVDTANFCTLYTPDKEVTIGTGWIDTTCPPEGVLADFNVLPSGVTKTLWFNPKAGHGSGNKHGGRRIGEILGK